MRAINVATHAKIRIRGRGSGHLEVEGTREAPVPLMVAVTSEGVHKIHFKTAVQMTVDKLNEVQALFKQFCQQRNLQPQTSWPRDSIWRFGEMSKEAETTLAELLALYGWEYGLMQSIDQSPQAAMRATTTSNQPPQATNRHQRRVKKNTLVKKEEGGICPKLGSPTAWYSGRRFSPGPERADASANEKCSFSMFATRGRHGCLAPTCVAVREQRLWQHLWPWGHIWWQSWHYSRTRLTPGSGFWATCVSDARGWCPHWDSSICSCRCSTAELQRSTGLRSFGFSARALERGVRRLSAGLGRGGIFRPECVR